MEHICQTTNENCGPTCVAIVTNSMIPPEFDIPVSKQNGTTTFQLASYLNKKHKKNSTFVSYFNPSYTTRREQFKLSPDELLQRFIQYSKPETIAEKLGKRYAINYVKYVKGDIEVAIPTEMYLDKYLNQNYKAICLITSKHLYLEDYKPTKDDPAFNYHFVVITKHKTDSANYYKVYDPLLPKPATIKKHDFVYSLHVTVTDTDCGTGATIFFK